MSLLEITNSSKQIASNEKRLTIKFLNFNPEQWNSFLEFLRIAFIILKKKIFSELLKIKKKKINIYK